MELIDCNGKVVGREWREMLNSLYDGRIVEFFEPKARVVFAKKWNGPGEFVYANVNDGLKLYEQFRRMGAI